MYICNDSVCDPCCDFCWYCVHGKNGEPALCEKNEKNFDGGIGYCDEFITDNSNLGFLSIIIIPLFQFTIFGILTWK